MRINGERFSAAYDEKAEMGSFTITTEKGGTTHPGSYGSSTTVPSTDQSAAGSEVSATVKSNVTVSGSTAIATVNKDNVAEAVKKAGSSSNATITVDAASGKSGITKSEVSVPSDSLKSVKNDTKADIIFKTDLGDVSIKNSDISLINASSSSSDVKLVLAKNSDGSVKVSVAAGGKDVAVGKAVLKCRYKVDDALMKSLADKAGADNSGLVCVIVGAKGADGTVSQTVIRNSFVDKNGYATVFVAPGTTISVAAAGSSFSDVKEGDWYAKATAFAVAHKLFEGVSDTEFAPSKSMTRGMFVTVLNRLADAESFGGALEFNDVQSDKWYATGTAWAASKL